MNLYKRLLICFTISITYLISANCSIAGTLDFCFGVKFRGVEFLKSQGLFGSETPDLYPDFTVRNAFIREMKISKHPELMTNGRSSLYSKNHPAWGQFNPTTHYFVPSEKIKSEGLCQLAQKKQIKSIAIVCTGDTETEGWPNSIGYIKSECFLSTHRGPGKIQDYERKRWGQKSQYRVSVKHPYRSQYDALNRVAPRKDIYGVATRMAINNIVNLEEERNHLTQNNLNELANQKYLFSTYGEKDLTISPLVASCMKVLPHKVFKKWIKIQMELEEKISNKNGNSISYTSEETKKLVENIIFILLSAGFIF